MIANTHIFIRNIINKTISKFCIYKYPYNINREEHANYLKKVNKAQQDIEKVNNANLIPRRKRRVYDRPRHDTDLTNYAAWRLYDPQEMLCKFWAHGAPVVAKLQLQPKWVIHAFGMGLTPLNHQKSATLQFSFEDNNFSKFLLYEYRNTTLWKQNQQNYNYDDQSKIPQKQRKVFRLNPEQFWKSQAYFQFRLNCSAYAEYMKFKKWIQQTIESSKKKQSYDDFIDKKYGSVLTFNKKQDESRFQPSKPMILQITPNHFNPPKKGQKIKPPQFELPKKLGQQYRVKKQISKQGQQEEKKVEAEASKQS